MSRNLDFLNDLPRAANPARPATQPSPKQLRWRPGTPIGEPVVAIAPERETPDNAGERKHFYMVPNLMYDLGLSSPARDLYGYYASRAGSGTLWQITEGSERIGRKLRLHKKTVLAARRELIERGLIRSDPVRIHGGMGCKVTVLNIWPWVKHMHDSAPG